MDLCLSVELRVNYREDGFPAYGSKRFQYALPTLLRCACRANGTPRPLSWWFISLSKSRPKSSCAASGTAGSRFGEDAAVAVCGRGLVRSKSAATLGSRSRTCLMVSDSLLISVSTGIDSSVSAARTRAKPLVFGNRLPRLVTTRLITPGVVGAAPDPSSPLSLPLERWGPSVPRARLSRRLLAALFQPKYPPLADSILRIGGGEVALGDAMEL